MSQNNLTHTLKMFRNLKGVTSKEIAAHLDISTTAYGKYETGETEPKNAVIKKISIFLGINYMALINESAQDILDYYNGKYKV